MPKETNHAERLAAIKACELASELIKMGEAPMRARYEMELFGLRVTVEVRPASDLPGDLTPCEQDIIAVLRGRRHRLTTIQILGELDGGGKIHGESTVKAALARLAREKVVTSSRAAPRGYLLAERYQPQQAADAG